MVESFITAATLLRRSDWERFRDERLVITADPGSGCEDDWWPAYWQFRRFPRVGDAIAWYLVRNLYGGPFLKSDVHIWAIARHFF